MGDNWKLLGDISLILIKSGLIFNETELYRGDTIGISQGLVTGHIKLRNVDFMGFVEVLHKTESNM